MIKKIRQLINFCFSGIIIIFEDQPMEQWIKKSLQPLILKQFLAANLFFMAILIYQALKCLLDDKDSSFKYILDLFGLAIITVGIKNQAKSVDHCEILNLLLSVYFLLSQCLVQYYSQFEDELIFSKENLTIFFRTMYLMLQIQVAYELQYILLITIISFINLGVDKVYNEFHIFSCLIILIQFLMRIFYEKSKRLLIQNDHTKMMNKQQSKFEKIIIDFQSQDQVILFEVQDSSNEKYQNCRFLMIPQLGEYNNFFSESFHNLEDKLEIVYRNQYSEKLFPGILEIQEFLKKLFVRNLYGNYDNFKLFCINFSCQQKVFNIQIDDASFSKSQIFSAQCFPSSIIEAQYSIEITQCCILDKLYILVKIEHNKIQMQKNIISSRKSSIEQNIENNRQDLELLQEQRIVNLAKNISFGMSHEFKTPLNAIQLLCESCVAQIQQKDFNKKQLNNLTSQQNNVLQVEGSFDYNRSQFDLNEILEELKVIFIEQFRSKGIILNIENNLKNSVVYQDRQRLLQILINIVGNALKFTFAGQVKLSIKKLENKCLFFEVQDSGIGMNEETVNNLFQLQDGEQKERKKGSGFGLTITKQVLDRIGPKNSIKVQSIQDEKTIVQFQIFKKLFLNQESKTYFVPFENIQRKKRVQTIIVQPSLGKSQSITSKKELKILIVDDTSINISALKLLMKLTVKQRIIIDEAYNGLQAVNMFNANDFDVIFMDINMPIMDGFEAIREIRNIEEQQNRNRSIIAIVTAFGPEEMKKSPCDANTILHKPIQKDQILQFFKEFMKIE